jgi:hypothetical protein
MCLHGRIASLRGTRNLDVFCILSRFLRSVRLALHPARRLIPHFLKVEFLKLFVSTDILESFHGQFNELKGLYP